MASLSETISSRFSSVWAVDFEFQARAGERPLPHCMVACNLLSGQVLRVWHAELVQMRAAPFDTGPGSLVVAFYASAEIGCFLALGWPVPMHVLDLFTEFRVLTNGRYLANGNSLLGALCWFGLESIDATEKVEMRELAIRGGPFSPKEQLDLVDYCQTDVDALARLLPKMASKLDLDRALLRGAYMVALAYVEHFGVPIDLATWQQLKQHWSVLKQALIDRVDGGRYGVYHGTTFKAAKFAEWLRKVDIQWPRLPTGKLRLDEDTFDAMALLYPIVQPLRDLHTALGKMRSADLAVGSDRRNRSLLSAFRSKTGRNQPSNSKFIFGPARWMRFLIQPPPGRAIAYIDWSQQEFGIAAYLSADASMIAAYESGDCYMTFAIQAGAAPAGATKATHGVIREQFKRCVLATQYLMGEESLAGNMGCSISRARGLLSAHRKTYATFWQWSERMHNAASLNTRAVATYGWAMHVTGETKSRTLYNFPMQANGAEMLRLAIIFAVEDGVQVCAPVHDAILIEADADKIDDAVALAQACMARASAHVLKGFCLRSEAEVIRWPNRFPGKADDVVLAAVQSFLADLPVCAPMQL